MKHVFIINPAAGEGLSETDYLPRLLQYLKDTDVDYEIHRTLNKQEVGLWTRQRAETGESCRFYAVGGDGTVSDIFNGIAGHKNAELAVIPCGSGNDFVRNFTNKKNFSDITKQINGKVVSIDAIKYNDSYCVNQLNIGTDCDVCARANELRDAGKAKGSMSYILAALQILPKHPQYRMAYELDGIRHEEDLMLVAIANGGFCGGGFNSGPKASLNDGLMDVGIVSPVRGPKLFPLLMKYREGKHLEAKEAKGLVKYVQLKEFELEPLEPCIASVDGEVYPFEKTHFKVVRNAINFVIPKGSEMINK